MELGFSLSKTSQFLRLSEGRNQDWLSGLFASHPPSEARVEANRKTAARLPAGGELGVERYAAAMRKTRAAMPAYGAYDQGRQALADDVIGLDGSLLYEAGQKVVEDRKSVV